MSGSCAHTFPSVQGSAGMADPRSRAKRCEYSSLSHSSTTRPDTHFYSHWDFKCLLTNKLLGGLIVGFFCYIEQVQMRQALKSWKSCALAFFCQAGQGNLSGTSWAPTWFAGVSMLLETWCGTKKLSTVGISSPLSTGGFSWQLLFAIPWDNGSAGRRLNQSGLLSSAKFRVLIQKSSEAFYMLIFQLWKVKDIFFNYILTAGWYSTHSLTISFWASLWEDKVFLSTVGFLRMLYVQLLGQVASPWANL